MPGSITPKQTHLKEEEDMKRATVYLVLFCFAAVAASFAATDNNVGTWKLNEGKSKIAAGASKNTSVVYTAEGDSYKCVTDGVDGSGKPTHTEWTGKFDGKDYPVAGDASGDTRSVQKVDARHYKLTTKKGGKTTLTGTIEFSADAKTRTLTTTGTDVSGKKSTSVAIYDRQ